MDSYHFMFTIGHTLKHHRRKMTPTLPKSSPLFIPDLYKGDDDNKERLLLHDNDNSILEINKLGNIRSTGRVGMDQCRCSHSNTDTDLVIPISPRKTKPQCFAIFRMFRILDRISSNYVSRVKFSEIDIDNFI